MGPGVDGPVVVFILRAEARRRKVGLIFFWFPPEPLLSCFPFYLFGFFWGSGHGSERMGRRDKLTYTTSLL